MTRLESYRLNDFLCRNITAVMQLTWWRNLCSSRAQPFPSCDWICQIHRRRAGSDCSLDGMVLAVRCNSSLYMTTMTIPFCNQCLKGLTPHIELWTWYGRQWKLLWPKSWNKLWLDPPNTHQPTTLPAQPVPPVFLPQLQNQTRLAQSKPGYISTA